LHRPLGYESPADLVDKYPQFYWDNGVSVYWGRDPLPELDLERAAMVRWPMSSCAVAGQRPSNRTIGSDIALRAARFAALPQLGADGQALPTGPAIYLL